MDTTQKIIETINQNKDGVTINPKTGDKVLLSSGYAVALTDNKIKSPTRRFINSLVRNISGLNQSSFIGSWTDGQDYYVDISLVVDDLNTAVAIGKAFNQKAIFDFSTMQSLNL